MKITVQRVAVLVIALGLAACSGQNGQSVMPGSGPHVLTPKDTYGGTTTLNVLLGDAAPDLGGAQLTSLNIGIREIDGIENGVTTVLGSYDRPRVVNVLAHEDDNGEPVANANVSRTDYQQIRLVVDVASSNARFKQGHMTVPLNFLVNTSTQSSVGAGSTTTTVWDGPGAVDMVVTQPFSIANNGHDAVRVDFNAFESLALDAYGDLLVRPTLFVAPLDDLGHATGYVENVHGAPVKNASIAAIAPDGSVGNTGFTNRWGHFNIGTLRAGSYKLIVFNQYTAASGRSVQSRNATSDAPSITGPTITITSGEETHVGTIRD